MKRLPSIDLHAHIEPDIEAADLVALGSLVFAATRSLDEAASALDRADPWTVWGVGSHPGVIGAQKAFDPVRFADLITRTPYVSEVGLDGTSRVPLGTQQATFEAILTTLQTSPRITSIHSYDAIGTVLNCLAARPIQGAVLHWWLGDEDETRRAVALRCYFSINESTLRRPELLAMLPLDRVLAETDHPFGDRSGGPSRRPGNVDKVEAAIGRLHGLDQDEVRRVMWRNLADLARLTRCGVLLPRQVRVTLAAAAA
jgi:TatD DNase family protein